MKGKRFFRLKEWGRLETLGGLYLKVLWQRIALPVGKYLVVPSSRGPWKFVLSEVVWEAVGYRPYDLKHLVRGRWYKIRAPEWCPEEVKAFGLDNGQRFSVRRVK